MMEEKCLAVLPQHTAKVSGVPAKRTIATSQRCVLWKRISNQWVLSMLAVINGHFVWLLQGRICQLRVPSPTGLLRMY